MIETTVVGSYPVPDWLVALPSEQALLDAMAVVLKIQENAGIDVVTDGELSRFDVNHPDTNGMIEYFVRPLANVRTTITRADAETFGRDAGMAFRSRPSAIVEGPLGEGALDLPGDYKRARALTRARLKFTLTGPHMLTKTLLDEHYRSRQDLCGALADLLAEQVALIDADVVQVDEANLPGHPEEADWALECINRILNAVQTTPAVHLCFGNYGGQTIQKGTYNRLVEFLNALEADHVVLELARRPESELAMLHDVKKSLGLGIGVIDIKDNEVETPETVAKRIARVADEVGADRIQYVHPDCGFWMLPRTVADAKMRALVAGRDLFTG